jgi:aryl-alcohol dehydrogenase-like predicted oxidoreductase
MTYRRLGSTGLRVSAVAFGAGPVPALMTGDGVDRQRAVLRRALDAGVNWIDTAATYGQGRSESSLGAALHALDAADAVQVATKVRLAPDELDDIPGCIRASVAGSLQRLGLERVSLLQLHNSVTARRGDEPTSITPADVLGPGGVLEAFEALRSEGKVAHLGLTGLGHPEALRRVIESNHFETIQVPFNPLNPSAGRTMPDGFEETDYGNIIADCARAGMGVFAIRVFAGGALAGQPPSDHTHKTKFFPLDLYQRDQRRAARLADRIGKRMSVPEMAVRFVLGHPHVTSAILGYSEPAHVDAAVAALEAGPLPDDVLKMLEIQGLDEES